MMVLKSMAAGITVLCVIVAGAAAPALAQDVTGSTETPDSEGGRYAFSKQPEGFIRLDSKTGQVALCSRQPVGWACQAAPEDRALLENEIARLRRENAALKKAMLAGGLPLPPGAMPEAPADRTAPAAHWPADADIERMVAFAGRVWHRLIEAIERAQQQILNKS